MGSYQRRSRSEWTSIVEDQRGSGLSIAAYCVRAGLPLSTFRHWRRRLRTEGAEVGFVTVTCEPQLEPVQREPAWDVELDLGDGMTLRLRRRG